MFDKTQFHHPSFEPLINETKKKTGGVVCFYYGRHLELVIRLKSTENISSNCQQTW